MTVENREKLIGEYAMGKLSPAMEELLFKEALEDQGLFDELMDSEPVRQAMRSTTQRRRLMLALWWQRVRSMFRSPVMVLAGSAAAAVLVAAVWLGVQNDQRGADRLIPAGHNVVAGAPADLVRRVMAIQPSTDPSIQATFATTSAFGGTPTFTIGSGLRLQVAALSDIQFAVIESLPNGDSLQVFPQDVGALWPLAAGMSTVVPPPGSGNLSVGGPVGLHTLRVVALPNGAAPASPEDWERLLAAASVVDLNFRSE